MNHWRSQLFLAALIISSSLPVFSDVGSDIGGEGISSWDLAEKKEKKVKQPDAFIMTLAHRYSIKQTDLARLWARGYGRNELIKLILISKASGKSLRDIVQEREKEMKLRDIARKYGVNYSSVTLLAVDVRKEIDSLVVLSTDALKSSIHYSSSTFAAPSSSSVVPSK